MNTFHYDGQLRRFILQFVRALSCFQVEFGKDDTGHTVLQQVPVIYGDSSRHVASIIRGNSENIMSTVPAIACYITDMTYDRDRVQEPHHVSKMQIREREYDPDSGVWGSHQGGAFTVERAMPVPYSLTLNADIWTSNQTQKQQLIEQILPIFNPALEIQSTDNYIDWTSLTSIFLESVKWTSRSTPMGAEDSIDVFTLTFKLPIWISLPVKVKKLGVIQKIIASVFDENGDLSSDLTDTSLLYRKVLTPLNFGVVLNEGMLRLYRDDSIVDSKLHISNHVDNWITFFDLYGASQNGITTVKLTQPSGGELVGTVVLNPMDDSALIFTPIVDTNPTNSLRPVTAIIDPYNVKVKSEILSVESGTRYLIVNPIGSVDNIEGSAAWHGSDGSDLIAGSNDIIEYDGVRWFVSFKSGSASEVHYVVNNKTGSQYKWDGEMWVRAVDGKYGPGDWTIIL